MHERSVTALRLALMAQVCGSYPAFIAPTGSCARPLSSCRLRLSLFLQVFAGCVESLLHNGLSRRYLRDPCQFVWIPTPSRFCGASFVRFFPQDIGLASEMTGLAREIPRNAVSRGSRFRGCNHSLMFRLTGSLGSLSAPTFNLTSKASEPYTPGTTHGVAADALRHRYMPESGQLT